MKFKVMRAYIIGPENGKSGAGVAFDERPGDGVGSSMAWKNRWMVNDALVHRCINNFHRDELRAERHHVQCRIHRFVLLEDAVQDLSLLAPGLEFEHRYSIFLSNRCCQFKFKC